ncbi:hypothetical protein [Psychrobacter sp.]|uniref:hypothetical protein n=1 Tax=Psychrobacter sp. TaxID=56811 RepID=UPI0026490DC7|nr:hypothetical protein [Psychrobacter sp.]MDN6275643.1 hypothetical protein [Psychrobacter sp.]MDN6307633.1 hypothetical protein [Psychrobacter sp.]
MSVANKSFSKWQKAAGIGMICGLALAGCDRSETEDTTQEAELTEQDSESSENAAATAVSCDDPMVQDRLKTTLKNTLSQNAQTLAADYANEAEINIASGTVADKARGIVIDIQNAAVLQEANSNGMTTCQASVSMTLPSEDLYQSSQVQSANNQPSLQSRLAENNIRSNNNMLVDDAFTYVVGTQGGQVRTRIAGQPALINVVSDVMAGSAFQAAMNEASAEREAERRAAQNEPAPTREPRTVEPIEPIQPIEPATPPSSNNQSSSSNSQSSSSNNTTAAAPEPSEPAEPKEVPQDESIDMVIIEDDSATY